MRLGNFSAANIWRYDLVSMSYKGELAGEV